MKDLARNKFLKLSKKTFLSGPRRKLFTCLDDNRMKNHIVSIEDEGALSRLENLKVDL